MCIVSSFLDLAENILLEHWDRKNKFLIFSIRCLHRKWNEVNKYIFQLTKYEHKDVRESIDSDNTNLSSIGFAE